MLTERFSIYKHYVFFAVIAPALLLVLLLVVGWMSYQTVEEDRSYRYARQAEKAAIVLTETIDYISNFSRFLGQSIALVGKNDASSINAVLQNNVRKDKIKQDIFTWTMFDFINPEGFVIAASTTGILPKPFKVEKTKRSWIESTPKNPWKLYLDPPDIGMTSGEWVIPTGFGITDNKGAFMGILSMGVNIRKLSKAIESTLSEGTDFLLLTHDYKVVASSGQKIEGAEGAFFASNLAAIPSIGTGILPHKLHYKDVVYSYYSQIQPYPYLLLIGNNAHMLDKEFKRIVLPQIIQMMFFGLFLLLLLYFFRSRIISPLIQLSIVAQALAKGQTDVIIPAMDSIEATYLADALAQIKEYQKALSHANADIRQMNVTLEKRVIERTRELEESLKTKEEFLNNMSHEIRTPVACIQLQTDMLLEEWKELDEPLKLQLIKDVQHGCLRLFSLLNNLLDLARFKSGRMAYRMRQENLRSIIQSVIYECRPLYESRGLEVVFLPEAKSTFSVCDASRIGQVIRNLLANAIKFTEKGTLTLSLYDTVIEKENEGEIAAIGFCLIDEGVGIPAKELGTIFSAFIQSSTTKTGAGGTGLGLAICREIITAHQGKIWAENNKNGVGAVFSFVIPVEQEEDREE